MTLKTPFHSDSQAKLVVVIGRCLKRGHNLITLHFKGYWYQYKIDEIRIFTPDAKQFILGEDYKILAEVLYLENGKLWGKCMKYRAIKDLTLVF